MMKATKVLVDTCFLIELASPTKECHQDAIDYISYFNERDIDCYLSPIVVAEYWQNNKVEDLPVQNFKLLSFNYTDGVHSAEIATAINKLNLKRDKTEIRDAVKDDYKLLAQLIVNNKIDCFITKDAKLIRKYVEPLKELIPALKMVEFIDIKNQPIAKTFKPQTTLSFPESEH